MNVPITRFNGLSSVVQRSSMYALTVQYSLVRIIAMFGNNSDNWTHLLRIICAAITVAGAITTHSR